MVVGAELVVNLDIESRSVRPVFSRYHEVLMGAKLVDKTRNCVGWRERIVREEIVGHRVKSVLGNNIAGERCARPSSVGVLANGAWIVNRVSDLLAGIEEIEVAVQHVGTRHVACGGIRGLLVLAL